MITTVREDRLAVVSDIHLGNVVFRARRPFLEFLRHALEQDFSVCINGDGVDMMHFSLRRLSKDLATCAARFADLSRAGRRVYYVVGNHDIVLEHFLSDWGLVQVVPFLNVLSGDRRVRIEHGHLYDDLFVGWPRTYSVVTYVGGIALRVHPGLFHLFDGAQRALGALAEVPRIVLRRPARPVRAPGERPCYADAAAEIADRGFDAVVLGHTHRAGEVDLGGGHRYYNTGSWLDDPHVLEIVEGATRLRPVFGGAGAAIPGTWRRARGSWTRLTREMPVAPRRRRTLFDIVRR